MTIELFAAAAAAVVEKRIFNVLLESCVILIYNRKKVKWNPMRFSVYTILRVYVVGAADVK